MPRPRLHTSNAARQKAYRRRLKRNARALRNSDEWYTPPEILALVRRVVGTIDLDPASCAYAQKTVRARRWFDKKVDGLKQRWPGRVFLNPPFSSPLITQFTGKLIEEYDAGRTTAAILVVNNATDTRWFKRLFGRFASCFAGRVRFYRAGRKAISPRLGQVFFYLGPDQRRFGAVFGELGRIVPAPTLKAIAC